MNSIDILEPIRNFISKHVIEYRKTRGLVKSYLSYKNDKGDNSKKKVTERMNYYQQRKHM